MNDGSALSRAAASVPQIRVVLDRHVDVVEASSLASALSAAFRVGNNLVRSLFLNPESERAYEDWEAAAALATRMLRAGLVGYGRDPRFDDLVGELASRSPRFGEYWARADTGVPDEGELRFFNPITGMRIYRYLVERVEDRTIVHWVAADEASRSATHDLWERSRHLRARNVSAR